MRLFNLEIELAIKTSPVESDREAFVNYATKVRQERAFSTIKGKELATLQKNKAPRNDGPFVKMLDKTLASFHVQRQAYYSCSFVGNHVHSALCSLLTS